MRVQVTICGQRFPLRLSVEGHDWSTFIEASKHQRWLEGLLTGQGDQEFNPSPPILIALSRVEAITLIPDW